MSTPHVYALTRAGLDELEDLIALPPAALDSLAARASLRETPKPGREGGGRIAVLPITGMIEQRPSVWSAIFGGTSTQRIAELFRLALGDRDIKAVVLDVSSGGGSVFGVTELANEIMAARGVKPVVAVVNSMAASAAYWIAAAADEVVSTPSGISGSVGVYAIHHDTSKADEKAGRRTTIISAGEHKANAVDGQPLSDAGREAMQAMVDSFYTHFTTDVARGRGVSVATVRANYGKGLTLTAPAAKAAGVVDRIETMDDTLRRLSSESGRESVYQAKRYRSTFSADDGEAQRRAIRARATVAGLHLVADNGEAQRSAIRRAAGL